MKIWNRQIPFNIYSEKTNFRNSKQRKKCCGIRCKSIRRKMKEWYTSFMKDEAKVIIPANIGNPPETHEKEAAWIIARHYNCVVKFLKPIIGYKVKTADFVFRGVIWEHKCPISKSRRRCVSGQLDRAKEQSRCIVFDARKTELNDNLLINQLDKELGKRHSIRKLIFITKNSEIIELK